MENSPDLRSCIRPDSAFGSPVMLMGITIGHSRPLAEWIGNQRNGVLFCIGSPLNHPELLIPVRAHVLGKGA